MSDGQRSGRSTGKVSCKSTELKRCSMIEMRWNKYEVSLASPAWTQIRRPSSEIKFRVVELKTPRFSTATLYYYFIYLSISPEGQDQRRTNTDEHLKHFKIHIKPTLKYVQTLTSTKPTIYSNIALSTEKDRATTTCKVTKNLAKFGQMVLEIRERTERHTDSLIAILRTPSRSEATSRRHIRQRDIAESCR